MHLKASLFVLATAAMIQFTGCAKQGCTDERAINYDSGAKENDGSCEWDADVVFWFDPGFAGYMQTFNISLIRVFFGGDLIGTMTAEDAVNEQPTCSSGGGLTTTRRVNGTRNPNIGLRIEDQNGFIVDARPIGIRGGECTAYRIN
jgi:hypothetical protein